MAEAVYVMGTVTSLTCAILLFRSYRQRRTSMLLWSCLCFVGLAANNVLLLLDLYAVHGVSLAVARGVVALLSVSMLLFGLLWNTR